MAVTGTIVGSAEVVARLRAEPEALRRRLTQAMTQAQRMLLSAVKDNLGGAKINVRQGLLRRSAYADAPEVSSDRIIGRVGVNTIYARLQNLGGEVSGHLAIPLDAVLTARGVQRFTARDVIAEPWLVGASHTFTRGGIIFATNGKQLTPLFKLALSVRIPAHLYMEDAMDRTRGQIIARLQGALNE